jgi:membrane protein implicated in regulation of membrane protease activity
MKLQKKMLFFLPYFFIVNIACGLLVQDWKYSMKIFAFIYAGLIIVPLSFMAVLLWKSRVKKTENE